MIVVNLMGGLGNQMFQYSMAKSLSLKNNVPFFLDRQYLDTKDWRNYDLDIFNIEEKFATSSDKSITIDEGWSDLTFRKDIWDFDYTDKDVYLVGYFQNVNYLQPIYSILKSQFTLKNPITKEETKKLLQQIQNSNSVMINVRRTDFVNNSFHGTLDTDYYNSAISIIKQKIYNPKFFIFSDDIEWCWQNLSGIDNSFIVDHSYKGDRFSEYFELMKNCKHFIIPNSSFGWWSAYLSDNVDKIVIAPKNWFLAETPKIDIVSENLNWIKI